jgi:hypothetical protein
MTVKVGINGFGRIGRQVYKAIYENYRDVLDVEAVNDLMDVNTNAHLLKYDSTYGRFPGDVEARDGDIYVDGQKLKSYAERDPANLASTSYLSAPVSFGHVIRPACTWMQEPKKSSSRHRVRELMQPSSWASMKAPMTRKIIMLFPMLAAPPTAWLPLPKL